MGNYIKIGNQKIELTAEQVEQLREALGIADIRLSDIKASDAFHIGKHEFVVLDQFGETAAVICKNLLKDRMEFGSNNCYDGSSVDKACNEFAEEIAAIVGAENLVEHSVDLTSDDGLKDYGFVHRRASLLTTDLYRRYVDILGAYKIDKWWWLATPHSTKRHENDAWVKCVAPSGSIDFDDCDFVSVGVRPFCILKSNIFVSK